MPRYTSSLALAAVAAQILFVVSWLVVGAAEGHGYQPMRHDISDLGAASGQHAAAFRLALFVTGAMTMAFGILVVRPVLRSTLAGVLVALSLPGFDNLTDAFFRVDCRAADGGCSTSDAFSTWHGRAHLLCFLIAAVATIAAPFVMARAMSHHNAWRSTAGTARSFGVVTIVLLAATAAASGSPVQGAAQRVAATVIPLGLALFGLIVARRAALLPRVASLIGGR